MTGKLFIYPADLRLTRGIKRKLEDAGYIVIPEDRVGAFRIIDPLPDVDLSADSVWVIQTLLEIVLEDNGYGGTCGRFATALLKRMESKVKTVTEGGSNG